MNKRLGTLFRVFRRSTFLEKASGAILVLFVLIGVFAPIVAPKDPLALDVIVRFRPPSREFLLGTDYLGRDILSRVIFGARISLLSGFIVPSVAALIGVALGSVSGFVGGGTDEVLMRAADVLLCLPDLIFPMVIVGALGPSLGNALLALIIVNIPIYARLSRGDIKNLKQTSFVEACRAIGMSNVRVLIRHLLPNAISTIVVRMTLDIGRVIRTLAMLSFLGLGAQPPTPEWGLMTSMGRNYFRYWWYAVSPGLAIFLVSFSIAIVGDALNDILNPFQRQGGRG